ncbi:MAG: hypothetical protein A2Y74_03935 [Actinobacteria bacterium RBG_13_63_9]|jgi:hypothetical protein|nr:MAG: hypothetical protein A2Y74_03935 [Actinobacteria bacterium RBG_13_63_9]
MMSISVNLTEAKGLVESARREGRQHLGALSRWARELVREAIEVHVSLHHDHPDRSIVITEIGHPDHLDRPS